MFRLTRRGRERGRRRRSLLAAKERSCWRLGCPSVRSGAWLAPCLCEEIGIDDLTRRKGTPRRARWRDLRVRGDLDTEWLLTGALLADGEIQQRKIPSFWSASMQGIMSERCAGVKGRGLGQREMSGSSYLIGIDEICSATGGAPARNHDGLAVPWEGRKEGVTEGTVGAL
jgi:hypothetical protein